MWEIRDLRFGGLKHRYKTHKGRRDGIIDPFRACDVKFPNSLQFDNWLLRVFTPGVITCFPGPFVLAASKAGERIEVKCDLLTEFSDGLRVADMVVKSLNTSAMPRWSGLQVAGPANKVEVALRTLEVVRGNEVLLSNLEMMRQHLVQYSNVSAFNHHKSIQKLLAKERVLSMCSHELMARLADSELSCSYLNSAIFILYRKKFISLNIAEAIYGPDSVISIIES